MTFYIENSSKDFETAYRDVLTDIKMVGVASSPRGKRTRELLGYTFKIENPIRRIIGSKHRRLNIFYAIGNFLWVMSQSNDLDFIKYYNPRGVNFSDDGKTLRGAYGKRIFDIDGINQYNQCIKELKIDPDSRRAIIHVHLPQYDWAGSLDTCCTSDFQFLIREDKLHLINHMRSQSSAFVMPYDVFLMTMLHEFTAIQLGVELGEFIHISNSIHYYESEEDIVDKLRLDTSINPQMRNMPKNTNFETIKKVLEFEKYIREKAIKIKEYNDINSLRQDYNNIDIDYFHEARVVQDMELDSYWSEICLVLIAKALNYVGLNISLKQFVDAFIPKPYNVYIK